MYKWIMDSRASNHMISHRTTFVTYEIMALHNIYLDDDGVVEAIGIGSIVVELMVKDKMK